MYAQGVCGQIPMDTVEKQQMNNQEIEYFSPREVCISLKQGDAGPARPVVSVGDHVVCGQLIGAGTAAGVPVYSSISGTVKHIFQIPASVYENVSHVVIEREIKTEVPEMLDEKNDFLLFKSIGIIGLIHTSKGFFSKCTSAGIGQELCLAAFDREPHIYSDYRLLIECPAKVIFGAKMLARIFHMERLNIYVCADEVRYVLEKAVNRYQKALEPLKTVHFLQVSEDMYAKSCIGMGNTRGLWCSAVELCAVYDGFYDGKPMTGRPVTVGGAVKHPKNLWVPNGTRVQDLLEFCGGILRDKDYVNQEIIEKHAYHVVEGGPLRGHCVNVDEAVVSLKTESILVLPEERISRSACILCRECCRICPEELKPVYIERALEEHPGYCRLLEADRCTQCGWCSYICPSGRPLKEKVAAAGKIPWGFCPEKQVGKSDGPYIELDGEMALRMESLVPEAHGNGPDSSQSGPYIHSGWSTREMTCGFLAALALVLAVYGMNFGPWIILAGILGTAIWLLLDAVYGRLGKNEILGGPNWAPAVYHGILSAMAFYPAQQLRWVFAAVFLEFIVSKKVRWNSALTGITLMLGLQQTMTAGVAAGTLPSGFPAVAAWMCMFVFMIYKNMIGPWATTIFFSVYTLAARILSVDFGWMPAIFMAAVVLLNDYRNGGRDTQAQRVYAGLGAVISALLSAFFAVDFAVCLGLLIVNIIACNLDTYTI